MTAVAPEWFDWALRQPRRSHWADSGGTRIHYTSWNAGETAKPGLLLAHGFLGHARWWDFIAPLLTERHRVYALDFSGMGDSGHRAAYPTECFVSDLAAVIDAAGIAPGTVIGHSFGGSRLLQACERVPGLIAHAIVLDSYFMLDETPGPSHEQRPAPRPYPDEATALARFRLVPDQPCEPWVLEHLARSSLQRGDAGWGWRFDTKLRQLAPPGGGRETLERIAVPVSYLHAELSSVVSAERARRIVAAIPGARGPITLPQAGHHLMLDQPLALVAALRALLA